MSAHQTEIVATPAQPVRADGPRWADLVPEMEAGLESGTPWTAELGRRLTAMPPRDRLDLFREVEVRTRLRHRWAAEMAAADGTTPTLLDALRPRRWTDLPYRLIRAARKQFARMVEAFQPLDKLVAWHTFQVQAAPAVLRRAMNGLVAFTWLPGRRQVGFTEEWVDLAHPRCVSLNSRRHRLQDGRIIDVFDVKVHAAEIDPESGQVSVGGRSTGGQPYSRTQSARYFSYAPKPVGDKDRSAPSLDNPAMIEAGLAMHRAIEDVAVGGRDGNSRLVMPEVYLGFSEADRVNVEHSPAVTQMVVDQLAAWLRGGRPSTWPEWPALPRLDLAGVRPPRNWDNLVSQVGVGEAAFLAASYWDSATRRVDELSCVPARFFFPYSEQRPVRQSVRVLAHFPASLLRREAVAHDAALPVVQVFGGRLKGMAGQVAYDFAEAPDGLEAFFAPARRPDPAREKSPAGA